MHYTLRIALQTGTPLDGLRQPHVWLESEAIGDSVDQLERVARDAQAYLETHDDARWDDLMLELSREHGAMFDDGAEPWEDAEQLANAVRLSLTEVQRRVQLVYDAGMGTKDELGEALSTLSQITRWLDRTEVPA